jgi:hypothetical protein
MSDFNDTTPPPAAPAPPAKRRKLMWFLVASLLANAVLAGVLIGQVGRGGMHFAFMDRGSDRGSERSDRADRNERNDRDNRPSEKESDAERQARRAIIRAAFDAERPALNAALADLAAARKQSAALIRADALDSVALDASLAQMRLSSDAAQASFHRAITAAAEKLDAKNRGGLARLLDRAPARR